MDPAIVAIIVALAAPIGAYLIAARRFSGKIESSDAKELWAESRSIRDWSQGRITTLDDEVRQLKDRVGVLETSNDALARENRALAQQVHDLNETIRELRAEIAVLTEQLKASRNRVAELEEDPDA